MRFIYKTLLFLIIFNSILVLFAVFFPTSTIGEDDAINITGESEYQEYKITGPIATIGATSVTIIGISFGLGILGSWVMKSPVPIGAGLFAGIITALYVGPAAIIYSLDPTNNWIIAAIISLIAICIGILVAFSIVDMFTQQSGAD